jgi:hypothetical protein
MQAPMSNYSQHDQNATLRYLERKDREISKEASQISRQSYKGRYS